MPSPPKSKSSESKTQRPAPPSSILIIGAGVFGLSTTLALLESKWYEGTRVTVLEPGLDGDDDDGGDDGGGGGGIRGL
ncbi:hypothetical protein JMJ35_004110 [Cladonia borealis]|uniref:FAD dependent oxidoreductase domain-containing protein n=1 Tax=Cladonia borealis TaxID=184061 RepID=A0AA39R3U6_9LECA|nr:hypothetical protein JMJ35_004110 [Cladonia borealis]